MDSTKFLAWIDTQRQSACSGLSAEHRDRRGQFLTPCELAARMAAMFSEPLPARVRLLDAGAGVGSLSAAFILRALEQERRPKEISVWAVEIERAFLPQLGATMARCEELCRNAGVRFHAEIEPHDFVAGASSRLATNDLEARPNCAILNPPYGKIRRSSAVHAALCGLEVDVPNLYAAFVSLALRLLAPAGQLVAITPRSFCNGPYFGAFRRELLATLALRSIHVFDSRSRAFEEDRVLQENVIVHGIKGARPGAVSVSRSFGPGERGHRRTLPWRSIVQPNDPERFIRLALEASDDRTAQLVTTLDSTLPDLAVQVSTGRVVEFRARAFLRRKLSASSVPLIHPCHLRQGLVEWPGCGNSRPRALIRCADTADWLLPAGNYVLTKRFTSKEERRRVVAALYAAAGTESGLENHLNYYHREGRGLPGWLARGLWLYLNSSLVDAYFRQFSGHTQVNATDLRSLRYPNPPQLRQLARLAPEQLPSQALIDRALSQVLTPSASTKSRSRGGPRSRLGASSDSA